MVRFLGQNGKTLVPPVQGGGAKRRGAARERRRGRMKRPQRLGRHLPWHEQSEVGRLSANPEAVGLKAD